MSLINRVASSLETPEQSSTQSVNNESSPQDLPNINSNKKFIMNYSHSFE